MRKLMIAGILATACAATSALATPISGTSLQTQLAAAGANLDVDTDQYQSDQQWTVGSLGAGWARIMFELAGYANQNVFGIYDVTDPTNRLTVFLGPDNAGSLGYLVLLGGNQYCAGEFLVTQNCATFGSNAFGFFLSTPQGYTYNSQTGLNADGFDHMVAFQGGPGMGSINGQPWLPNEFILAWEDLYGGGDRDYDDFAVMVESVIGLPEPGTLGLYGLALLVGGLVVRRKAGAK